MGAYTEALIARFSIDAANRVATGDLSGLPLMAYVVPVEEERVEGAEFFVGDWDERLMLGKVHPDGQLVTDAEVVVAGYDSDTGDVGNTHPAFDTEMIELLLDQVEAAEGRGLQPVPAPGSPGQPL